MGIFGVKYNDIEQRIKCDLNITHRIESSISFRVGNIDHDAATTFLEEIRRKIHLLVQEFFNLI